MLIPYTNSRYLSCFFQDILYREIFNVRTLGDLSVCIFFQFEIVLIIEELTSALQGLLLSSCLLSECGRCHHRPSVIGSQVGS
jgi:hypothetical protein